MVWLSYVVKGPEDLNEEIKGGLHLKKGMAWSEQWGREMFFMAAF